MSTRINITEDDGNIFFDVTTDDDTTPTTLEAIGILEATKVLLLSQRP